MVVPGRRKSIAFFIALGIGLISVIILLYVGGVLSYWRSGILLFLGVLPRRQRTNGTQLLNEAERDWQHITGLTPAELKKSVKTTKPSRANS